MDKYAIHVRMLYGTSTGWLKTATVLTLLVMFSRNNFYPEDFDGPQCMGWTWYLANDMQFYIISPAFILPLHLASRRTHPLVTKEFFFVVICALCFAITTYVISIDDHMEATPTAMHRHADNHGQKGKGYASQYYEKPWCRISVSV